MELLCRGPHATYGTAHHFKPRPRQTISANSIRRLANLQPSLSKLGSRKKPFTGRMLSSAIQITLYASGAPETPKGRGSVLLRAVAEGGKGVKRTIAPPPQFWVVEKLSNSIRPFGVKTILRTLSSKINILSIYNHLCRKFTTVCRNSVRRSHCMSKNRKLLPRVGLLFYPRRHCLTTLQKI